MTFVWQLWAFQNYDPTNSPGAFQFLRQTLRERAFSDILIYYRSSLNMSFVEHLWAFQKYITSNSKEPANPLTDTA